MTKQRPAKETLENRSLNGDKPSKITIEGIVPPFEERLAEFQRRVRELQDELQIAILPYIKQYNTGQSVAAVDFIDRLPTG